MVIWHMWVQSLGSEVRYWLESIQESNYSPHGYNIASVSDSESHVYVSLTYIFLMILNDFLSLLTRYTNDI